VLTIVAVKQVGDFGCCNEQNSFRNTEGVSSLRGLQLDVFPRDMKVEIHRMRIAKFKSSASMQPSVGAGPSGSGRNSGAEAKQPSHPFGSEPWFAEYRERRRHYGTFPSYTQIQGTLKILLLSVWPLHLICG
jgi:hypothetical protein